MAGTSTLGGSGWTANPTPDQRYPTIAIYACVGQPAAGLGKDGDLSWDAAASKIYRNTAGTWNAGTTI